MSGETVSNYRQGWYTSEDGLRLFYRDYPGPIGENRSSGAAVLCLGGVTRNSRDFDRLAERLSSHYRVLCPDFRGRGLSAYDPNPDNYNPTAYVNDVRHLLAVCGVSHVHVIGTSLGGFVAMVMAVSMPTALDSVVLNDIGPEIGSESLSGIIEYMKDDTPLADLDAVAEHVRGAFLQNLPHGSNEDWLRIARNTYRETAEGMFVHAFDKAIVKQFHKALTTKVNLWPLFRALGGFPVLTLRGELSGILSAETLRRMADVMPAMTSLTVEDRGHPPLLTEPPVLEAIDAHLARAWR